MSPLTFGDRYCAVPSDVQAVHLETAERDARSTRRPQGASPADTTVESREIRGVAISASLCKSSSCIFGRLLIFKGQLLRGSCTGRHALVKNLGCVVDSQRTLRQLSSLRYLGHHLLDPDKVNPG